MRSFLLQRDTSIDNTYMHIILINNQKLEADLGADAFHINRNLNLFAHHPASARLGRVKIGHDEAHSREQLPRMMLHLRHHPPGRLPAGCNDYFFESGNSRGISGLSFLKAARIFSGSVFVGS